MEEEEEEVGNLEEGGNVEGFDPQEGEGGAGGEDA